MLLWGPFWGAFERGGCRRRASEILERNVLTFPRASLHPCRSCCFVSSFCFGSTFLLERFIRCLAGSLMGPASCPAEEYQWVEMFAGTARATQCVSLAGYRASMLDIDMGKNGERKSGQGTCFDILSPSGFANLDWKELSRWDVAFALSW